MAPIKDARYTSPGGNEYTFAFGNVSRTTELKTSVFTYPMLDGATVQHQGRGAMTFPLACIFHGADCMETATAFEEALYERGVGELQHPIYGTHRVKPTGNIVREDPLVTGMNQSTVTITFTQHLDEDDELELNEVAANAIDENYDLFENAAAADFAEALASVENVGEQLAVVAALETQAQSIIDNTESLAMSDRRSFADWLASANELKDSIRRLYDRGISAARRTEAIYVRALNIARLTLRLMKLPSRLAVTLSSKIQGYAALTAVLINQFRNDPFDVAKTRNAFAAAMLGLSGAVATIASGAAISTAQAAATSGTGSSSGPGASSRLGGAQGAGGGATAQASAGGASAASDDGTAGTSQNPGTASREEAVETAARIIDMLETVTAFSDARIAQNIFIDANSVSYINLKTLVIQSAKLIKNASFALPMQRIFTLDRDRQVIELCAELYGTVDLVDGFIISNNFSIDEIELLPMGTRVMHYVQGA